MNLVRRYPAVTLNIGMGVAVVLLIGLVAFGYNWLWVNGGSSDSFANASRIAFFYVGIWGAFLVLGLAGGFAGKWLGSKFGLKSLATVGSVSGMIAWLVLVETYFRSNA